MSVQIPKHDKLIIIINLLCFVLADRLIKALTAHGDALLLYNFYFLLLHHCYASVNLIF